jgi:hypothetical protein
MLHETAERYRLVLSIMKWIVLKWLLKWNGCYIELNGCYIGLNGCYI